jgi:hypothetical protein
MILSKTAKKLSLSKQTLRKLATAELDRVAGGARPASTGPDGQCTGTAACP